MADLNDSVSLFWVTVFSIFLILAISISLVEYYYFPNMNREILIFICFIISILTVYLIDYVDDIICAYKQRKNEAKEERERLYSIKKNFAKQINKYDTGLRWNYRVNSGLSQIICKHCLKTVLVKNIDIACPFCDTKFVFGQSLDNNDDDNRNGVAIIELESEIEAILFKKCPVCESMIPSFDCYHCNQEIDVFEEYNKSELEAKRYV